MKSFKEFIAITEEGNFEVGQSIKFDVPSVSTYVDVNLLGGFDYGDIISKTGGSYTIRLQNGNEINVKALDVLSFGDSGDTPE